MNAKQSAAGVVWKQLNGLICVYKPSCYSVNKCLRVLRHKLVADLNAIDEAQSPRPLLPAGGWSAAAAVSAPSALTETAPEQRLSRRLVTGPAFEDVDVRLTPLASLGWRTSGPLVLGLNAGTRAVPSLRAVGRQLRVHQLTGRLGLATDTLFSDGRATDRATYGHVSRGRLEAVLSSLQAAHQRHMMERSGLPANSQAAYELAARGPPRPEPGSPPVVYGLRCVQFAPPFFTLEVHAVNESEQYLLTLMQDLGRMLRSAATTVRARCLRHGPFTLEHALLLKHWRLVHVRDNMAQCLAVAAGELCRPLSGNLQPTGAAAERRPAR